MIVYDLDKSEYGLSPLKCYRLSENAINALQLNKVNVSHNLIQEKIRENDLDI